MNTTDIKPFTNLQTLTRFLLTEEMIPFESRIEFANLFTGISLACKITSNAIKRAGFDHLFGLSGNMNVHGEDVKKLDEVANDAFITALKSTKEVCLMVSEEEEKAINVEKEMAGKFVIAFDPLDGSTNIDANVSVGSIFSIFQRKSQGEANLDDIIRPGREMICGGYALYGSATMLVITSAAAYTDSRWTKESESSS